MGVGWWPPVCAGLQLWAGAGVPGAGSEADGDGPSLGRGGCWWRGWCEPREERSGCQVLLGCGCTDGEGEQGCMIDRWVLGKVLSGVVGPVGSVASVLEAQGCHAVSEPAARAAWCWAEGLPGARGRQRGRGGAGRWRGLPRAALRQVGLCWGLCSSACSTSSPSFFTDLGVCRVVSHTLTPLSGCKWAVWFSVL